MGNFVRYKVKKAIPVDVRTEPYGVTPGTIIWVNHHEKLVCTQLRGGPVTLVPDLDQLIANKLAYILCGGDVAAGAERTEQDYLDLEREVFLSLAGTEKSQARMQSILMTNKPLRN